MSAEGDFDIIIHVRKQKGHKQAGCGVSGPGPPHSIPMSMHAGRTGSEVGHTIESQCGGLPRVLCLPNCRSALNFSPQPTYRSPWCTQLTAWTTP